MEPIDKSESNGLSKEILEFLDGGEFDLICESGIYESDKRYY